MLGPIEAFFKSFPAFEGVHDIIKTFKAVRNGSYSREKTAKVNDIIISALIISLFVTRFEMELRRMKRSIMVQWTNLLQTTAQCYGWQVPLLCLKLDQYA